MALIVQKYGGSSLADADKIRNVAHRVVETKTGGVELVVVVSAMGNRTNELLSLAYQVSDHPNERELDLLLSTGELDSALMLALALRSLGCSAIDLSGLEAGIKTDANYGRARILSIDPSRIIKELKEGKIVVVAGFQGATEVAGGRIDITTFGRGGSDITAVALAARLGAERCEIYHTVDGVLTFDPDLDPEAHPRQLAEISYEEMLELASCGSKVLHPRAVELAWVHKVPILVANTFNHNPGTLIHDVCYGSSK